jgi:hypothetical protein
MKFGAFRGFRGRDMALPVRGQEGRGVQGAAGGNFRLRVGTVPERSEAPLQQVPMCPDHRQRPARRHDGGNGDGVICATRCGRRHDHF